MHLRLQTEDSIRTFLNEVLEHVHRVDLVIDEMQYSLTSCARQDASLDAASNDIQTHINAPRLVIQFSELQETQKTDIAASSFKAQPVQSSVKGLSQHQLQTALNYIQTHLSYKIHIRELATQLNLSPYYFCRLFKQSTGRSPYQYLTQQRVERAKFLLKQHHLSIVDVAYQCGFSSQSHLTKHFKQHTGTTPKRYRNSSHSCVQ